MSRTKKGSKSPGYEFWSSRPGVGTTGRISKTITKRSERMAEKRIIRNETDLSS